MDRGLLMGRNPLAERDREIHRIRDKLEHSLFWTAFMLMQDVVFVHTLEGDIIQANPAAQEMMGYPPEELELMNIRDVVLMADAGIQEKMERLYEGEVVDFQALHRRRDGSLFECTVRARVVKMGGRALVVGVAKDLTKSHVASMLNNTLERISYDISLRMTFDDIMRSTIATARREIGADVAVISMKEDGQWVVRYSDGVMHKGEIRFDQDDSRSADIVERTGMPILINDVQRDSRTNKEFAAKYSIRSLLTVPLRVRGRMVGLMAFIDRSRTNVFSDAHLDFASKLSHSVSLLLDNAMLAETEKATSAFLGRVLETVPDAIVVWDRDGKFTFANKEAERMLGVPREEVLKRYNDRAWGLKDLQGRPLPDEDMPFMMGMRAGRPINDLQFISQRADGREMVLSINLTPSRGRSGLPDGVIASLTDITAKKISELKLKQRTHQLEVLTSLSLSLNSQLRTGSVMGSLVSAAMELTEAEAGCSGLYMDGKMVCRTYNDRDSVIPIDLTFPQGYGVPGWVIVTRRSYLTNDAASDPHVAQEVRERFGFRSLVDVPIINGKGELLGCFEIHNKAGGLDFTREDVSILEGLAAAAAVALDNAYIMEEKTRYEADLRDQKREYQTVFESVPAMIAIKDLDGRVLRANRLFLDTFGLAEESREVWTIGSDEGTRLRERSMHEEVVRKVAPVLGDIVETTSRDGRKLWLEIDRLPYLDHAGRARGVIMFCLDITAEREAQERLRSEKEYFTTLTETTPSGTLALDREGRITFANRAAEDIMGVSRDSIRQVRFADPRWELTDFDGRPLTEDQLTINRVIATGRPVFGVRHAIRRPDGRRVMLLLNAAPLYKKGELSEVILTMEDVTSTVLAEKALQASLKTSNDIVRQIPSGMLIFRYEAPDGLVLESVNPTANSLLGGLENKLGLDFDQIWKQGMFFATKEEFVEVVATGRTIWREGVYYSDRCVDGSFTFRAFCLPEDRLCVNFDDVTERVREAELRRKAYTQIEENIEHFATLVDRIRNPLSAIMAQNEKAGDPSASIADRAEEIEDILKQLDRGWLESEKVRGFLKRSL